VSPFAPHGDRARWRIIYDLLATKNLGETLAYEDMAGALELDAKADRTRIQLAFRRASQELERENNRATEAVANTGYRIVEPTEHLRLAKAQQRKSGKSLERGQSKVLHVDLTGLEPEVRKAFDVTARAFAVLLDYNRRLDTRQDQLESALDSIVTRQNRSEEEVARLKERLARLEERT
jgi:hypothetical protein